MLGNAVIVITLDTYSHVLTNMQVSPARVLEDSLRQWVAVRLQYEALVYIRDLYLLRRFSCKYLLSEGGPC